MSDFGNKFEVIEKLNDLIKDIKIAMLATIVEDVEIHSRPMAMLNKKFDGSLYFFTKSTSGKSYQIKDDSHVNLAFSDPASNTYVSISGKAKLIKDKNKFEELWTPICKIWFPEGIDDPELALLEVEAISAEYWDSPSSTFVKIFGFVKGLVTGNKKGLGENERINL